MQAALPRAQFRHIHPVTLLTVVDVYDTHVAPVAGFREVVDPDFHAALLQIFPLLYERLL